MPPQTFKESHDAASRKSEAEKILKQYPDRIPVIVERCANAKIVDIDKKKFLVPGDLPVMQFIFVVRKRIKLSQEQALFLFVETQQNGKKVEVNPPATSSMASIYAQFKDEDKFLYISYKEENVSGAE